MLDDFKRVFMTLALAGVTLLQADITVPMYGVEKGLIVYDVYGGGPLTPETNLTLEGNASLRFSDFGKTLLSSEEGIVITSGALQSRQAINNLEKQTGDALFTVDFQNEKIHERKNSISKIMKQRDTKDLNNAGQEEVAGVTCDVWEGDGIRKCLYKGIPLKIESDVLGISYHKVARIVDFDTNSSSEVYVLPDFPIEDFALFNSAIKTKNEVKAKCFTDVLKDVAYSVDKKVFKNSDQLGIDEKEKTEYLNTIGQKIYENQKKLLPELLLSMKETRECLQTVENSFDANECIAHFSELKKEQGTEEKDFIRLWDEKNKTAFLDKIEDAIYHLQSRLPCIERAKNITDLSACMK